MGWRFRHPWAVAGMAGMQLPSGLLTSESLESFGGRQGTFRGRDYWEADLPLARVPDLVRGESVDARAMLLVRKDAGTAAEPDFGAASTSGVLRSSWGKAAATTYRWVLLYSLRSISC